AGTATQNIRFENIYINAGTWTTGVLDLKAIGSETTAKLNYWFDGNFTTSAGTTLNIFPNVRTGVVSGAKLTIGGTANFEAGSNLNLYQNVWNTASELVVSNGGILNATDSTFTRSGNYRDYTYITVQNGGRLRATGSTFSTGWTWMANDAVFQSDDWTRNKFDQSIYVPAKIVQALSNALGMATQNIRFENIYIHAGTWTTGVLDLKAIGSETTAKLNYWFNGNFTTSAGTTLNVFPNVRSGVVTAARLTIGGSANFEVGSILNLYQNVWNTTSELVVGNGGILNANDATFTKSGNYRDSTSITVQNGGRIRATGSTFSTGWTWMANDAVFESDDLTHNRFDQSIYVPAKIVQAFSNAAGTTTQNIRFENIYIHTGTWTTGVLDLKAIGSESTAKLNYWFNGNFTTSAGTTLNVFSNVRTGVVTAVKLTIGGTANFSSGSNLNLNQTGWNTTSDLLVVNGGVVNATGATFTKSGSYEQNAQITVESGGTWASQNSTISSDRLTFGNGSTVNISFDGALQSILGGGGISRTLTNYKSISADYGSSLTIPQSLQVGSSTTDLASFTVSFSSTLAIAGHLRGRQTDPSKFRPDGKVIFNGKTAAASPQDIETWSNDLGSNGFGNNLAFGTISIENNSNVRVANSTGATGKALYINTLNIAAGSRFDANNQKVYVRKLINAGTLVNNANVVVVADGGPLLFATPTPGEITTSQTPAHDEWTFTTTQNGPVTIAVNPGSYGTTAAASPQIRRVRIELRNNANTLLKSIESTVDNNPIALQSDNLTQGSQYRIRVLSTSGSQVPGNYMITLLNSGSSETGLSIGHEGSDSIAKAEGNAGATPYKFTISRVGDLTLPTTVAWSVSSHGATAASASDFENGVFPSGTVSFAANDSSNTREITINVLGDSTFEPDESFVVSLSNPSSGSAILVGTAISRILNDDAPDKSDLIVSAIVPPTAAQSGQNVLVQWTEKNDGPVPVSGDWSTNLKVTRRSTGAVLVNRNIRFVGNSLPVNTTVNRTSSFDLPDGTLGTGDFDILITVDALNDISEQNTSGNAESNNARSASFNASIGNYPEISVSNIQHPSSVQLSVPFDVSWTVINTGTGALTKPTTDRVYLSLDGTVDGNDRILATISSSSKLPVPPNGNYVQTATVTLPLDFSLTPGSYQIIVVADYLNNQFELNENNNQRASAIDIGLPPLPDLIVESISSKDITVAGQSVELTWTLKNQATAPVTGTWGDRVFLSSDAIIGNDLTLVTFPITTTIAPNGKVVRKQIVQIPANISGEYRFVVASDIGNTINEYHKEDNNITIADTTITIDATPSPNLVVESITAQTSGLFSGQSATIEWIVKNIGNASTNTSGWVDAVYLSTDSQFSNDDILLGRTQNPSYLNSDDSYRNTLTATIPNGTQGIRYFIVFTDGNRQVLETGGEDDNTLASSATNITLTPPPDLRITTLTHPRNATEGDSIQINWTILNDGTGNTRQTTWSDQVWLSLNNDVIDAGDILLSTVPRNGALAPQQEYQVLQHMINLPLNAFAERAFLVVRTDVNNEVYEDSFEGNNDRASEIQIFQRPIPDLEVESIVNVPSAIAGQPMNVTYTVVNASVNPTIENSWRDSVYLSTDTILNVQSDLLLGRRTRTGILGGNQSETRSYDFVLPNTLSGNFYLIVFTDSAEQVVELSDTNNSLASTQVTSIRIDPPDLLVISIGTSTNPMAGRDVTISYVVTNRGNSPTPNTSWQDSIYLSDDGILDASDIRLDERQRVGVLAPNQSEQRTTTVRLPENRFGTARIIVHSDSSDLVYELNNSNNIASTTIQIGDNRPDLQVASFALRPNNPSVAPGGTLSFDFEIANRGIGPTFGRSWTDRVVLSTDLEAGNSDDIVLGSFIRSSDVGAGQSYFRFNQSVTIPSNIRESQYWLYLVTDATGLVSELNETNNVSLPIEVVVTTSGGGNDLADLVVSEVTVPATANSGERLPIQWEVQNSGVAITTSSTWFDSVWLSTNSALDEGDILVGRFARVGSLAPGESYIRSIDWPIGIDFSGSYFTIVRT
ncbi:MAG: CARDB domain-containing protein, partial [Pirellula sp.]